MRRSPLRQRPTKHCDRCAARGLTICTHRRGKRLKRTPLRRGATLRRKTRMNPVNRERRAATFRRNFHSVDYVEWTKRQPCAFCGEGPCVTAHVNARGMGGAGGDWTRTLPMCADCDDAWDGIGGGRGTFLTERGLTWDDVEAKLAVHQERWRAAQGERAESEAA